MRLPRRTPRSNATVHWQLEQAHFTRRAPVATDLAPESLVLVLPPRFMAAQYRLTLYTPQTRLRGGGAAVDAGDAAGLGNPAQHFPCDRAGPIRHLARRNLGVTLTADEDDLVAARDVR